MFTPPLFGRGVSVSNTNTDAIDLKLSEEFCTAIQYHHHRTNDWPELMTERCIFKIDPYITGFM